MSSTAFHAKFGMPDKAFQRKHLVMWDVPEDITAAMPAIPKRLYINKVFITPLENALRCLIIRGKAKEIKTWDGLYNNRPIRGYEKKFATTQDPKYLSTHAWACAIDVNAAWNGLGKVPTLSAGFVKCFTDNGFVWGGNFNRPDGMHMELDTKYI